jgi:hypothetical protein
MSICFSIEYVMPSLAYFPTVPMPVGHLEDTVKPSHWVWHVMRHGSCRTLTGMFSKRYLNELYGELTVSGSLRPQSFRQNLTQIPLAWPKYWKLAWTWAGTGKDYSWVALNFSSCWIIYQWSQVFSIVRLTYLPAVHSRWLHRCPSYRDQIPWDGGQIAFIFPALTPG